MKRPIVTHEWIAGNNPSAGGTTMSAGGRRREVAHRLFAVEFDAATVTVEESDEEMAPTYVLTPAGALVNRVFVVGALTEVEQVGDDVYRGRVHDPTGTFIVYAGQYQPDAANFLADAETPIFAAITAKARTFEPEGSQQVLTSLRPERIVTTDTTGRDRWVSEAARHTLARIEWFARARAEGDPVEEIERRLLSLGVRPATAHGIALAASEYETTATYLATLRDRVNQALEVTFSDGESVSPIELSPHETGRSETFADLADDRFTDLFVDPDATPEPAPAVASVEATSSTPEAPEETSIDETPEAEPIDDTFDPDEEFALSTEERERIEEEFGTEFETGSTIDPSGTEDPVETPAPEVEEPTDPVEEDAEETEDFDLKAAVLEHMTELDTGDGVERSALVEAVADGTGASHEEIDDAIQDALMSGSCYEPQEDRLKPI